MKNKIPRNLSYVKFSFDNLPEKYHGEYPFVKDGVYIFLGEIPNMSGHCVVLDTDDSKIYTGYHSDDFIEIPESEC